MDFKPDVQDACCSSASARPPENWQVSRLESLQQALPCPCANRCAAGTITSFAPPTSSEASMMNLRALCTSILSLPERSAGCLGMGSRAVFICGDGFIITFSVGEALSQRPRPALFDPSSRASVLNFLPAANQWCTYGATAAETRVAPRLKKPLDLSTWAVPSL